MLQGVVDFGEVCHQEFLLFVPILHHGCELFREFISVPVVEGLDPLIDEVGDSFGVGVEDQPEGLEVDRFVLLGFLDLFGWIWFHIIKEYFLII